MINKNTGTGTMPVRIQRKRTKGWKMPDNTVYVGRPTVFGNPYYGENELRPIPHKIMTDLYRDYINRPERAALKRAVLIELKGKNLACWCPVDQHCHADVLLELANE